MSFRPVPPYSELRSPYLLNWPSVPPLRPQRHVLRTLNGKLLNLHRTLINFLLMQAVILLTVSNIFMTLAWYGHLRFKHHALWKVILISWLIAFIEYCFQVPANRIGSSQFSTAQLKTIQEVITLIVFCVFSITYLKEPLKWNYLVGFAFMIGAVFFVFKKW